MVLPGKRTCEPRSRAFGRRECEGLVRRIFRDDAAAEWLLSDPYSLPSSLAPTEDALRSILQFKVSVVLPTERKTPVTASAPSISHEDAVNQLGALSPSGSQHPLWPRGLVVVHEFCVIPHRTLCSQHGETLILATGVVNKCAGRFFFPQDDVTSRRPSSSHPFLHRVVINISNPVGLEMTTLVQYNGGRLGLIVQEFTFAGGRMSFNVLLRDKSLHLDADGQFSYQFGIPCAEDIIKWSVGFESLRCPYCVLRGLECECPEQMYHRFAPTLDRSFFELFRATNRAHSSALVSNVANAAPNISPWDTFMKAVIAVRNNRFVELQQALFITPPRGKKALSVTKSSVPSRVHAVQSTEPMLVVVSPPFKWFGETRHYDAAVENTVHVHVLQSLLARAHAPGTECFLSSSDKSSSLRYEIEAALRPCLVRASKDDRSKESFPCSRVHEQFGPMAVPLKSKKRRAVLREEDQQNYVCDTCDMTFSRRFDLKRHVNAKHLQVRPCVCAECGEGFQHKWHLEQHVDVVHKRVYRYPCAYCGDRFGSQSNLRLHVRKNHASSTLRG